MLRGFLQTGVFLLIVALFPLILIPLQERQPADSKRIVKTELGMEQKRLRRAKPDVLFVGNSMVFTRIDRRGFQKLSGRRNEFLTNAGSASACWYLYLKNIIVPSDVRPELTIVFFRDQMLTWPEFRTESYFTKYVESLQLPEEPVINRVLYPLEHRRKGMLRQISDGVENFYDIRDQPERFQSTLRDFSMDMTPFGEGKQPRRLYMSGRFQLRNLRHDLAADDAVMRRDDEPPLVFDPSPDASFLPEILKLANEHGIKLCFYRVKKRIDVEGSRPTASHLPIYLKALQEYVESQGALYFDETGDDIPAEWYADGDHIARDRRTIYTKFFWEKVKGSLPPKE